MSTTAIAMGSSSWGTSAVKPIAGHGSGSARTPNCVAACASDSTKTSSPASDEPPADGVARHARDEQRPDTKDGDQRDEDEDGRTRVGVAGSVDGHAHRKAGDAGHRQQPRESRLTGEPAGTAEGGHVLHRRRPSSGDRYEPDAAGRSRATRSHRPWVDGRTERSMVVWRSSAIASIATSPRSRSEKLVAVRSASKRARSNRRSTARWTRPRSGWKSAHAARVDAATASVGAWVTPRQRGLEPEHATDEHGDQDGRDHRPRDGAADDVVDRVQPVAEHGDRHGDRDPRQRDPEQDRPVADQAGVQRSSRRRRRRTGRPPAAATSAAGAPSSTHGGTGARRPPRSRSSSPAARTPRSLPSAASNRSFGRKPIGFGTVQTEIVVDEHVEALREGGEADEHRDHRHLERDRPSPARRQEPAVRERQQQVEDREDQQDPRPAQGPQHQPHRRA